MEGRMGIGIVWGLGRNGRGERNGDRVRIG